MTKLSFKTKKTPSLDVQKSDWEIVQPSQTLSAGTELKPTDYVKAAIMGLDVYAYLVDQKSHGDALASMLGKITRNDNLKSNDLKRKVEVSFQESRDFYDVYTLTFYTRKGDAFPVHIYKDDTDPESFVKTISLFKVLKDNENIPRIGDPLATKEDKSAFFVEYIDQKPIQKKG